MAFLAEGLAYAEKALALEGAVDVAERVSGKFGKIKRNVQGLRSGDAFSHVHEKTPIKPLIRPEQLHSSVLSSLTSAVSANTSAISALDDDINLDPGISLDDIRGSVAYSGSDISLTSTAFQVGSTGVADASVMVDNIVDINELLTLPANAKTYERVRSCLNYEGNDNYEYQDGGYYRTLPNMDYIIGVLKAHVTTIASHTTSITALTKNEMAMVKNSGQETVTASGTSVPMELGTSSYVNLTNGEIVAASDCIYVPADYMCKLTYTGHVRTQCSSGDTVGLRAYFQYDTSASFSSPTASASKAVVYSSDTYTDGAYHNHPIHLVDCFKSETAAYWRPVIVFDVTDGDSSFTSTVGLTVSGVTNVFTAETCRDVD
jgi:hypothetical protein